MHSVESADSTMGSVAVLLPLMTRSLNPSVVGGVGPGRKLTLRAVWLTALTCRCWGGLGAVGGGGG